MMLCPRILACLAALVLASAAAESLERDPALFIEPPGLEPDVQFWMGIYTEIPSGSGLLHDSRNLQVVYERLELPAGLSSSAEERYLEKKKEPYRRTLKKLGRGERKNLSGEEQRVLALFPEGVSNKTLLRSARRIRFQLGQADQFRAGLIRSGTYTDHVREALEKMGLPTQLAALPHVESSYTPSAYSRIGAAGLWQFTRATGKRFMRVDQVVDERRDPYRATEAAARLLAQNRRSTGSWPLAVTAYNHGASGMRRATRKLGHRDIEKIVREYRSRTFGFASRNFYVEFLAASRIAENPEPYFGKLVLDSPIHYERHALPFYASAEAVARHLGVDTDSLQAANPALLSPVWNGQKRIPRGFELKVPVGLLAQPLPAALASLPSSERFSRQTRDRYHVVRRGETLSRIAQKYRVPVGELASLNDLRNQNRIRVGQKLRLPIEYASGRGNRSLGDSPAELPESGLYTVRKGDSLALIALRYGVDEGDLARVNGIRNRHHITVDQVLKFPNAQDGRPPAAPSGQVSPGDRARPEEGREGKGGPEAITKAPDNAPILHSPANILADPSDYLVSSDGTIKVQFGETLGHYAEWLNIRAQQLRALNDLRFGEALPIHSRLRLDFSRVSSSLFEEQRIEFHRNLQERYFSGREIVGVVAHKLERGDSIWDLAHQQFKVPLWLLQQYNPDIDFETASAGTEILAPVLRRRQLP
ncbi:MAG: LysM peptidoglycan-binding domain-containing protein [Myxococcota bacterium]|nr:LysM peptidoglycan-binding domain-containing protein [Myxococcota bacterium]